MCLMRIWLRHGWFTDSFSAVSALAHHLKKSICIFPPTIVICCCGLEGCWDWPWAEEVIRTLLSAAHRDDLHNVQLQLGVELNWLHQLAVTGSQGPNTYPGLELHWKFENKKFPGVAQLAVPLASIPGAPACRSLCAPKLEKACRSAQLFKGLVWKEDRKALYLGWCSYSLQHDMCSMPYTALHP